MVVLHSDLLPSSNVCIKLELRPDSQHTAKTKPVSLQGEAGTVNISQQFSFKDLHYNRLQVGGDCRPQIANFIKLLFLDSQFTFQSHR